MTARIMLQGTGWNVGKAVLGAGLGRQCARKGVRVRPFKPQNMSNNAAATADGGEIGRAQALQARAAGVVASVHMNPVLLKPETDTGAQVIVQGQRWGTLKARDYGAHKSSLLPKVLESFEHLRADADLLIVEGAGSPAEINLRAGDIANMGFAQAADVPVVLVGDIDRGGVIASLVGTAAVLEPDERERIKGFLVNKFRGDVSLFNGGVREIAARTGWAPLGVLPFFPDAAALPAEDILDLSRAVPLTGEGEGAGPLRIGVLIYGRIANFDDIDPLRLDPNCTVTLVERGQALPGDLDLVILPGSKATIADLDVLRAEGWDIDLAAHHRRGGRIWGLCGGYQMLGRAIHDPDGIEGRKGSVAGLGLLDVETTLLPKKATRMVTGTHVLSGEAVQGYEIHLGESTGADCARPVFDLAGRPDGAQSSDGRVVGTYVHGLFAEDRFRRAVLAPFVGGAWAESAYDARIDAVLDALADHLAAHVDMERLADIAGL